MEPFFPRTISVSGNQNIYVKLNCSGKKGQTDRLTPENAMYILLSLCTKRFLDHSSYELRTHTPNTKAMPQGTKIRASFQGIEEERDTSLSEVLNTDVGLQ